ncbi:MAG: signal peptidase I [Aristaeellaceae bacterium]
MKVFRKLWSVITTLLVTVMVILAILLVGVRVVGLTPYAVLSGSMEPTYHVGSLIYVKDVAPADITVGMPITFIVNEDLLLATHRVVDIEVLTTRQEQALDEAGNPLVDEEGNPVLEEVPLDEPVYYYQTKGDANDAVDGTPVHYRNVVGTPVFSIPYLGYLSSWLQTRQGMIMGICIALVLVMLTFLPDLLRAVDEPKKPKRGKHEAK